MKFHNKWPFVLLVSIMVSGLTADVPYQRQNDHMGQFRIMVEIDGVVSAQFESVEGLESKTTIVEYKDGIWSKSPRKLPGFTTYSNIILRRGYTFTDELWKWRKKVVTGNVERKNGAIIFTRGDREGEVRFRFYNAWPVRWRLSTLGGRANIHLVEELEIAIEKLEMGPTRE